MAIKYFRTSNIKNKIILWRPDFNCPVEGGRVVEDFRIQESLPSLKLMLKDGNRVIICGHLGRPKGQWKTEFTFKPVAERLAECLNYKFAETDGKIPEDESPHVVFYNADIREAKHRENVGMVPGKDIVFLENMRFYKEEEDSDPVFAKHLADLAEVYVNDAFGVDHHAAASVSGVPAYLPSYAGLLLEKEIKSLDAILKNVKHPFVVMTGGIKLSEKVGALENLGNKADKILVGGGVATLMFKAKGYEVGKSRIEEGEIKTAWEIEKNFKHKLLLPLDVVVARLATPEATPSDSRGVVNEQMEKSTIRACSPHEVQKNEMVLDVGPKTILAYAKEIKLAKTIVWSGPLGMFEKKPFDTATMALARLIGGRGKGKAFVLAGGGDTVDAIRQAHQFEHFDHVSTGGGAMLEYLAGKKLPGIEALK